jgi:hypothetical protein
MLFQSFDCPHYPWMNVIGKIDIHVEILLHTLEDKVPSKEW